MSTHVSKPATTLVQGDRGTCEPKDGDASAEVGLGSFLFEVRAPPDPWGDEAGDPWVYIYKPYPPPLTRWRTRLTRLFDCNPAYFEAHFSFAKAVK